MFFKARLAINNAVESVSSKLKDKLLSFDKLADYLNEAKNWQDFETHFEEFKDKMPVALKNDGIDYCVSKIYSCLKDNRLRISYKLYHRKDGKWGEKVAFCELDSSTAPTWTTKALSTEELDVTARYEQNLKLNISKETPSFDDLAADLSVVKNWKEFETRLKEFVTLMPFALCKENITDYAARIYSSCAGELLRISYKIYYKQKDDWAGRTVSCQFDALTTPTWATKDLSTEELDVTARYEQNLKLNTSGDISSLKELSNYFGGARDWQDFETRLKEFAYKLPFTMKNMGIDDYGAKLFAEVENNVMRLTCKMYYKEDGKWVEYNVICKLDELKAPTWATKDLSTEELDVTSRYEQNLQLKIWER